MQALYHAEDTNMSDRKFEITDARGGTALGVRIITRATETEIAGKTDEGAVKIRVKSSPASNPEANQELVQFLAAQLSVAPDKIEIVAGVEKSDKILSIEGISSADVEAKLFPAT
jgi:uncharacterized protein YggU (UPF0235/DUF167 family)